MGGVFVDDELCIREFRSDDTFEDENGPPLEIDLSPFEWELGVIVSLPSSTMIIFNDYYNVDTSA